MNRFSISLVTILLFVAACAGSTEDATTTLVGYAVSGYVHAGPVCPVVQDPPDPACADRSVEGAVIVVEDASRAEVGRVVTSADGTFAITLAPGAYTLVPQPVEGLLGTAESQEVVVADGPVTGIDFAYDTGIR